MAFPPGRFLVAFGADTLVWDPVTPWTALDQAHPNLVTSYQIDRGRQYELDRTDTGRATVEIADPDGILDPTNTDGPFFGQIQPLKQAVIQRYNPVADEWDIRFRGFIEELDYALDPSQRVYRLTVSLVDIFEILAAIQMYPYDPASPGTGGFGDDPTDADPILYSGFAEDVAGQVWYGPVDSVTDPAHPNPYGGEPMDDRINRILTQAGIPLWDPSTGGFAVIFSGNVVVQQASYSPGESPMSAIQEAADAEFSGVSNVFTDRFGRLAVHGRLAKFDPAGVLAGALPGAWDYHAWKAGDGGYVASSPATYAHIRDFAFNRGLAKIINHAIATPKGIQDEDVPAQLVIDTTSIGNYGYRSWSAQNLLTKTGLIGPVDHLAETKRVATWYVSNFSQPQNRITAISFRSIRPGEPGASENWRLLGKVDIGDTVEVYVTSPAGGFDGVDYFVEGVHESCQPANPTYDDATVSLDLSPRAYFTGENPWEEEP